MKELNKELSKEMTKDFAEIYKKSIDPIEIKKKQLLKKREEILKDNNYGI